jgi:hypothetical protein
VGSPSFLGAGFGLPALALARLVARFSSLAAAFTGLGGGGGATFFSSPLGEFA